MLIPICKTTMVACCNITSVPKINRLVSQWQVLISLSLIVSASANCNSIYSHGWKIRLKNTDMKKNTKLRSCEGNSFTCMMDD